MAKARRQAKIKCSEHIWFEKTGNPSHPSYEGSFLYFYDKLCKKEPCECYSCRIIELRQNGEDPVSIRVRQTPNPADENFNGQLNKADMENDKLNKWITDHVPVDEYQYVEGTPPTPEMERVKVMISGKKDERGRVIPQHAVDAIEIKRQKYSLPKMYTIREGLQPLADLTVDDFHPNDFAHIARVIDGNTEFTVLDHVKNWDVDQLQEEGALQYSYKSGQFKITDSDQLWTSVLGPLHHGSEFTLQDSMTRKQHKLKVLVGWSRVTYCNEMLYISDKYDPLPNGKLEMLSVEDIRESIEFLFPLCRENPLRALIQFFNRLRRVFLEPNGQINIPYIIIENDLQLFGDVCTGLDLNALKTELLKLLAKPVKGINTAFAYVSLMSSHFTLHTEDSNFSSVSVHHSGESKIWTILPASETPKLHSKLHEYVPFLPCGRQTPTCFIQHKNLLLEIGLLRAFKLKFKLYLHVHGSVMVTGSGAAHFGLNCGSSVAIAANLVFGDYVKFGAMPYRYLLDCHCARVHSYVLSKSRTDRLRLALVKEKLGATTIANMNLSAAMLKSLLVDKLPLNYRKIRSCAVCGDKVAEMLEEDARNGPFYEDDLDNGETGAGHGVLFVGEEQMPCEEDESQTDNVVGVHSEVDDEEECVATATTNPALSNQCCQLPADEEAEFMKSYVGVNVEGKDEQDCDSSAAADDNDHADDDAIHVQSVDAGKVNICCNTTTRNCDELTTAAPPISSTTVEADGGESDEDDGACDANATAATTSKNSVVDTIDHDDPDFEGIEVIDTSTALPAEIPQFQILNETSRLQFSLLSQYVSEEIIVIQKEEIVIISEVHQAPESSLPFASPCELFERLEFAGHRDSVHPSAPTPTPSLSSPMPESTFQLATIMQQEEPPISSYNNNIQSSIEAVVEKARVANHLPADLQIPSSATTTMTKQKNNKRKQGKDGESLTQTKMDEKKEGVSSPTPAIPSILGHIAAARPDGTAVNVRKRPFRQQNSGGSYVCDLCPKCFWTAANLRQHKQRHKRTTNDSPQTFPCKICKHVCLSPQGLKYHHQRHHAEEKKTYSCKLCGKVATVYNTIKKHVLMKHIHPKEDGRKNRKGRSIAANTDADAVRDQDFSNYITDNRQDEPTPVKRSRMSAED